MSSQLQTCLELQHRQKGCLAVWLKQGGPRDLIALHRVSFSLALHRARLLRHLDAPAYLMDAACKRVREAKASLDYTRQRFPYHFDHRTEQLNLFKESPCALVMRSGRPRN